MKPALLVIDVQKECYKANSQTAQSLEAAVDVINAAITLFRAKNLPIICIQHINDKERLTPGTDGFELPQALEILSSDVHIHKTYGNAFNKTPLPGHLEALGVDTVILTGYCAEYCVLATYRGARDHDLTAIILRGALASGVPENIKFVENISEIISFCALAKVLE